MTKAVFCLSCGDIVAPYRNWQANRDWRWCQCDKMGVRWRDGAKGHLEVSHQYGASQLRVIGLNNSFLEIGGGLSSRAPSPSNSEEWRTLHEMSAKGCDEYYLFHEKNRNCWALIVRVGESGDVYWIEYAAARSGDLPGRTP